MTQLEGDLVVDGQPSQRVQEPSLWRPGGDHLGEAGLELGDAVMIGIDLALALESLEVHAASVAETDQRDGSDPAQLAQGRRRLEFPHGFSRHVTARSWKS